MASSDKVISYSDLKTLLKKGSGLLVDVRSKGEVDEGCIPGSIHIPVENVERDMSLDPAEFKSKFGVDKPSPDSSELVFHCHLGKRGDVATDKARGLGFKNARNYAGGYKECVPLWVASLLRAASRLKKADREKRKKVYRLIQRHLENSGIGSIKRGRCTYVYPAKLKEMIRSAFPTNIRDYPDPCHGNVVIITMEDLKRMEFN